MKITTVPPSRFGWKGETLHYVVTADGATEMVVPDGLPKGMDVRITDTRRVEGGIEAQVAVEVTDSSYY